MLAVTNIKVNGKQISYMVKVFSNIIHMKTNSMSSNTKAISLKESFQGLVQSTIKMEPCIMAK